MRKNNRTRKRLHLIPLIVGIYGALLGFDLVMMGLAEAREGIGIIRLLVGLGMAGVGLFGIWDGVRDLVRPKKKPERTGARQFIFTDASGNKTSLVTPELLREQIKILAESRERKSFNLQILSPLPAGEQDGMLKQIFGMYHGKMILVAYFDVSEEGYQILQKSTDPDQAARWLQQLLAGVPDFSGWECMETSICQTEETADQEGQQGDTDAEQEEENQWDDTNAGQEGVEPFWRQLLIDQKGRMTSWHQLLVIFGESWQDEHKFFSVRDMELTIEGIHEGRYTKAVLEWGIKAFDLFPGIQNELMVIWRTNDPGKGDTRFLAKEGTVTQVKFWLVNYLNAGFFEEMNGWVDITDQVEKVNRKGEKKHGKIL